MGLLIGNGVRPDAADDTGNAPYRLNVYVNEVTRDDSGAPGYRKCIVVQVHGRDFALGQLPILNCRPWRSTPNNTKRNWAQTP